MSEASLPIALQLYTMRAMDASEDERLDAVARAGYGYVEAMHRQDISAAAWRRQLDGHGLRAVSVHVPLEAFAADQAGTLQRYADLGTEIVAIPVPNRKLWAGKDPTADDWRTLGAHLEELGAACRAAGLTLLYHNHWQEMQRFDGQLAIDIMMRETTPGHVGLELDCAWTVKGGADPVALLQRYADRCPCVHMKDLAPPGQNADRMGLEDVGHGRLDWAAILPQARASGAQWYIVEHDMPADHVASITRSYAFIASRLNA